MRMKIDDKVYKGVAVLPEKQYGQYSFIAETAGRIDLFTLVTCSKYLSQEKSWGSLVDPMDNSGWNSLLRDEKSTSFKYSRSDLERRLSICQLYLEALENGKGRHSQALIDFEDSRHKLKAYVGCNLTTEQTNGVSICQNKAGNYMTLAFEQPTRCINDCTDYDEAKRAHDLKIPSGKCIWECKYEQLLHRLTTYGFDEKALR